MYLMLSFVARYVQTPASAGYGLSESVLVAGAVLVPFSLASFVASRFTPALMRRLGAAGTLVAGFVVLIAGITTFLVARSALWHVLLTMAIAGLGVGVVFAANPSLVVSGVPAAETGSALSFNQVLRNVGFSIGSALSGVILAAATPAGAALPRADGYRTAALVAVGLCVATIALIGAMARRPA
jgi:MFS family permease